MRCLLLLSVLYVTASFASLEGELEKFFQKHSEISNVSGPSAYQGQNGGYYTGGSLFARSPVQQIHPMGIQLPSFQAGCGGVDLFTGGFSFINSDQLIQMFRNISNNAKSLAFGIGIKTVMPLLANQMEQLNDLAQKVNQFNINSCEVATAGLELLGPQIHAIQENICRATANSKGTSDSYLEARLHCQNEGKKSQKSNNSMIKSTNVAWQAIKRSDLLKSDNEMAEFLMSLSGTLVFSYEQGELHYADFPSLAADHNLLYALIYGGEAHIYRCDSHSSDGCLKPTLSKVRIASDKAMGFTVARALENMVSAIEEDRALNPAEQALLNQTSLPIYRILNVYTTYAPASKLLDIHYYSELIAYDVLYTFLTENLKNVETLARSQEHLGKISSQFFSQLQDANKQVDKARSKAASQANHVLSLIEKSKNVEREIASQYASSMKNSAGLGEQQRKY